MEEKIDSEKLLKKVKVYEAKEFLFEYKLDGVLNKKERAKKLKIIFK